MNVCYNKVTGALAQLGARYIRIVEATGSNPVCSILFKISGPLSFLTIGNPRWIYGRDAFTFFFLS